MSKLFLVVDAGNTTTAFAIMEGMTVLKHSSFPTASLDHHTQSILHSMEGFEINLPAVVASVVPSHNETIARIVADATGKAPLFFDAKMDTGLFIDYDTPQKLGADRIANAVAAHHLYPEQNVIIVDIGTAINFDCVTRKGRFVGGAIAPGPVLMVKALNFFTDKLPSVDLDAFSGYPLGRDTISCIKVGVVLGVAGLVDGLLERLKKELSHPTKVIFTGGGVQLIQNYLNKDYTYIPHLTIKGLAIIAYRHLNDSTQEFQSSSQ